MIAYKPSRLTREEVDELFREYRATGSIEVRNRIAEDQIVIVERVANAIASRLPSHIEAEELAAFGMIGLLAAIENYDPSNPATFATYANVRVRGAILDEIRLLDFIPRLTRSRDRRISARKLAFYAEHGHQPNYDELRETMPELSDSAFARTFKDSVVVTESLNKTLDEEGKFDGSDFVPASPEVQPGIVADATQIIRGHILPVLGLRAALLLKMRYVEGMRLWQIGEALGVSESRMSQMHADALAYLRGFYNREAA